MFRLDRRYMFTGRLALTTALHVGGGRATLSPSDSPIVRTADGIPFIPGSSFKGVFRSSVERIAGSIPTLHTCALMSGMNCIGADEAERRRFEQRRRQGNWTDTEYMAQLQTALCDTCKLFGSHYAGSRLLFSDLHARSGADAVTQIRDGVGIDRDSEGAVPQIKYDFEVLEHNIDFDLHLMLENPSDRDLQLTCVGLAELMNGFMTLGGKRSRGLGRCIVTDLAVYELDLTDPTTAMTRLRAYLLGGARQAATARREDTMTRTPDVAAFLDRQIEGIFREEDSHA